MIDPGSSIFHDRREAGRALASKLADFKDRDDVVVLALPRGGVPVAAEVANHIRAPLDVFVVRKLGSPGHEELAMGAIGSGGVRVINDDMVRQLGIADKEIENETRKEQLELARQEKIYRGSANPLHVQNKTAILVDDGMATGYSMRAAVRGLRQRNPRTTIVAVPVAAREGCLMLETEADKVVCVETPQPFLAVGQWYEEFRQVTDDEIKNDLSARKR